MFKHLEDWSTMIDIEESDRPNTSIYVDTEIRIFPVEGDIGSQFDIVEREINDLEESAINETMNDKSAIQAWRCIESAFDGIYFWATAKNIQDYYFNRGGRENPNLTIESIRRNAAKPESNTFTDIYYRRKNNKPLFPEIAGATSSHDLDIYGVRELKNAGILHFEPSKTERYIEPDELTHQEKKFREHLYRLRRTKYNADHGRREFKYWSKYTEKHITVPRITSETAYENVYELLRETLIELKTAIIDPELREAIPIPLNKKQIEDIRKEQHAKTRNEAKTIFKEDFAAASTEEQLRTLNEMLNAIKDNEVLAAAAEKIIERL